MTEVRNTGGHSKLASVLLLFFQLKQLEKLVINPLPILKNTSR